MAPNWKNVRSLNRRWVFICAMLVGSIIAAIWHSPVGTLIDIRLVHHIQFRCRDLLGMTPEIDRRLKIYAFDDRTLSKTKSWVLSLTQWAKILDSLSANDPRAVVIDQLFSMVPGEREEVTRAKELISALPLRVITGAFLTPPQSKIPYREEVERKHFSAPWATPRNDTEQQPDGSDISALPITDAGGFHVYGPQSELQSALKRFGHLMYSGMNTISPFMKLDSEHVVPHASFLLSSDLRTNGKEIFSDGVQIPLRRDGTLPVNFISTSVFYGQGRVKTMHQLLNIVDNGQRSTLVNPGDVVLILPHMYTGHTDFSMTPYGQMPAGLILAATLNSVLTGNWVRTDQFGVVWIILLALGGGILASRLSGLPFWLSLAGAVSGVSLIGILLFAYQNVLVDWFPTVLAFSGTAIAVFAQKSRVSERVSRMLQSSFEGVIPETRMSEILETLTSIDVTAREANASIMFIDIVAFSKTTETFPSQKVFEELREVHQSLGATIHKFGGMIDRSLGDGALVYFGVDITDRSGKIRAEDHAVSALRCAVAIQQLNRATCEQRATAGQPIYPLRIGINTGKAFFGDIGTANRVDFTAIGVNVNFAKRLESSSTPHGICISESTYHLVGTESDFGPGKFERVEIVVKHAEQSMSAYSYLG